MSDETKKDSLGTRIRTAVATPEGQAIVGRVVHAIGRAAVDHDAQRRETLNRIDHTIRLFGEIALRSTRPWSPPPASGHGTTTTTPGQREEPRARTDTDEIEAERVRMQEERRLLRARQGLARDRIELEQLRRQTERMEAAAVEVQEGRRSPDEVIAQEMEVEREVPVDVVDEQGDVAEATTSRDGPPPSADDDEDRIADAIHRAAAALKAGDLSVALTQAETALATVEAHLKRFPGKTEAYQPCRQLALYFATRACVGSGAMMRAIFFVDEALEVVEAALKHAPKEKVLLFHARLLELKGDAKLKLARTDEAEALYGEAQATLREVADETPSKEILDDLVNLSRKLERMAREQRH
ncbi:MAG: hypothetical protein R3B09_06550 [Nannocystaceae bacterium]